MVWRIKIDSSRSLVFRTSADFRNALAALEKGVMVQDHYSSTIRRDDDGKPVFQNYSGTDTTFARDYATSIVRDDTFPVVDSVPSLGPILNDEDKPITEKPSEADMAALTEYCEVNGRTVYAYAKG